MVVPVAMSYNRPMIDVLDRVRRELESRADDRTKVGYDRFFKEAVSFYGVKNGEVKKIAAAAFREIRQLPKAAIFSLCEDLLRTDISEETFVALEWAQRLEKSYEYDDFAVFERWLNTWVTNWAACDTLCNHPVGSMVVKYPAYVDRLKVWTASPNRWVRRGAAVSLVIPTRRGLFLEDVFDIATRLMEDTDDLVRKGCGWMLKEAARIHCDEVHAFIVGNKARMPRTTLRYAVENMPPGLKKSAMSRD